MIGTSCLQYAAERKIIDGGYNGIATAVAGHNWYVWQFPGGSPSLGREIAPHLAPAALLLTLLV